MLAKVDCVPAVFCKEIVFDWTGAAKVMDEMETRTRNAVEGENIER